MEPTDNTKNNRLKKEEIVFSVNGNKALFVKASLEDSADSIVSALELTIKPKSVILVFGGASGSLDTSDTSVSRLNQILDDVLQYASDNDAIIIDGGTKSGIMEIVGQRASEFDQSKKPIILGVAPEGLISLSKSSDQDYDNRTDDKNEENDKVLMDPNHSHFVLVEGNRWGDETAKLFDIATALTTANDDILVVALLAGGGKISKKEVLILY